MARTQLDIELIELNGKIVRLGTQVDAALEQALDALKTRDLAKCGLVIASEDAIDQLRQEISSDTFRLLTLQQPLAGRDLRLIASAPVIASEFERIGDGAEGIAELLIRMVTPGKVQPVQGVDAARTATPLPLSPTETSILRELQDLGTEARRVLQGTIKAFKGYDVRAARYLWEEDDVVDVRYHMVRHSLMATLEGVQAVTAASRDTLILQRMTYYLWIAHNLERVADHCTNVCERIVFIVEGDRTVIAKEKTLQQLDEG